MLTRQGAVRLIEAEFQRLANINIQSPDNISLIPIVYRPIEFIMAEKTVATLLSKTLEQTPKFSGKPDQDADEWLKDFISTFRMADITESQALKIMPTFLEGPAKQWFTENITVFESWSVFKVEFLRSYSSPTTKQLASNRLRNRQQRYDEPVIEYYTDVMKLCKLIDPNMTDVSKLDHLYHGLKSSLLKEVLRRAPTTPSEFLAYAKQEETLDRLVTTSVLQPADGHISDLHLTNNSFHQSAQINEPPAFSNSSHMYYNARSPNLFSPRPSYNRYHHQSSPVYSHPAHDSSFNALHHRPRAVQCYRCFQLGHFARDCRATKKY
ncbi:unnamed protein product [Rotaria sp. Silwood2]|nr:unnamed protein product [Rotaria sp. Silwood2]CAF4145149.1 unnamed protein product [Rotaria sp. Silwood2]